MKFLDWLDEVPRSRLEAYVQMGLMLLIVIVLGFTMMYVSMKAAP